MVNGKLISKIKAEDVAGYGKKDKWETIRISYVLDLINEFKKELNNALCSGNEVNPFEEAYDNIKNVIDEWLGE